MLTRLSFHFEMVIITGTLLKRHRIPKHEGTAQHFVVTDLNVGQEVTFYGRTYKIVDCDDFSRVEYNVILVLVIVMM